MDAASGKLKNIPLTLPTLQAAEVHVWTRDLDAPSQAESDLHDLLSPDERERAARFRFEDDRRRFIAARGYLRRVLGAYTATHPARVSFRYSKHGKPSLEFPASDIRFNLSHSGSLALIALTRGREIGVDIEKIKSDVEIEQLATRFFSSSESATLRSLPAPMKAAAFFRGWTCKEAFLKAQGMGLSLALDSFDVDLNPAEPPCLLATRPHDEASEWSLRLLTVPAGYAAAVAVHGPIERVKSFGAESDATLLNP